MKKRVSLLGFAALSILTLFFISIVQLWHEPKAEAQSTCGGPRLFNEGWPHQLDPYWPSGTTVEVYFKQGDFTASQQSTIEQGFEAWEARRINNCSNVSYNTYTERASQPNVTEVGA